MEREQHGVNASLRACSCSVSRHAAKDSYEASTADPLHTRERYLHARPADIARLNDYKSTTSVFDRALEQHGVKASLRACSSSVMNMSR